MNNIEESLRDDSLLAALVEGELQHALRDLPVIWRLGTGLTLQRVAGTEGRWAWCRNDHRDLAWRIHSAAATDAGAGAEAIDFYYDLRVSRDLQALLMTHSNVNAGLLSARWFIRKATLIPFSVLTGHHAVFSTEPLSLGQLVTEICSSCEPNFDWPT